MIFCFDIDDTIVRWNPNRDYANFEPIPEMVKAVNALFDEGHTIKLYTSRGMTSVGEALIVEEIIPPLLENLTKIGLRYHELMTHKPTYDMFVDDKAKTPEAFKEWFQNRPDFDKVDA